ncbi:MAG: hypothetical protein AB2809_05665 [Candidatus Thiodiazotropha sp.]
MNIARLGFLIKALIDGLDWWNRYGYATQGAKAMDGKRIRYGC